MSDTNMIARDQLRSFVDRIERLEEEKATIAGDIKDVHAEAKGNGFDVKVLRKVIALRRQDANERQEFEAILDLYLSALGMLPGATEDLPMEMERVRRADRPKSGIDQAEADKAADRRTRPIDAAAVAAAAKPAKPRPSKSTKPKTADEARERLAAIGPTFD